ncbi:MAG: TonB-dependent receptor [Verrucomicrobia bacterium]|nr:TonB-dependent receptor [Verrucomicrobiota bacterium]MDA1067962.1 TonB-dependent receptor [Verrucomicrobiota bacterium]
MSLKRLTITISSVLTASSFGLFSQESAGGMDTVELDQFEIRSEFSIEDLNVDLSRSVLNENVLDIYGSTQLQDLSGLAPNLASINSDTRGFGDILSMRGSANSIFFGSPSVGLYVDGVPGGSVSTYPGELVNISSISILSGPQSTRFGRNASSGMIDIRTRRPGSESRQALQLEYGSYESIIIKGLSDGPISDSAAYSASIGYNARDGYIDNVVSGKTVDDRESLSGRLNFFMNPSDDLELRFGIFAESINDGATRLSSLFSPDPYEVSSNVEGITELDRMQLNFQLTKAFDQGELTATTSYQDWDLDPNLTDLDLSFFDFGFSKVSQDEELFNQEFRFISDSDLSSIRWTAGLFFMDSETNGDATRQFPVPAGGFIPPGFVLTEQTIFEIERQNIAAYINADTTLSDNVVLNTGLRFEENQSSIVRTKVSTNNFNFPGPPEPGVNDSQSETKAAGTIGLTITTTDSLDFIVRSSISHKPEGYSGFTSNPVFTRFNSEKLWSNELGINFTSEENRVSGSLMVFRNDTDDYQYERTVPFSTDFVVINAEKVSSDGIEGKLVFNPSQGLFFDFQAGYTNADFEKHLDSMGVDVSGNSVPFIPEYTVRTGVRFELENGLFGSSSYTAYGNTYYDELNQERFSQSSFGIWDAQIGYRHNNFSIAVYGRNLAEEHYFQFINPEIQAGSPGAPQRFGLRLDLIF